MCSSSCLSSLSLYTVYISIKDEHHPNIRRTHPMLIFNSSEQHLHWINPLWFEPRVSTILGFSANFPQLPHTTRDTPLNPLRFFSPLEPAQLLYDPRAAASLLRPIQTSGDGCQSYHSQSMADVVVTTISSLPGLCHVSWMSWIPDWQIDTFGKGALDSLDS